MAPLLTDSFLEIVAIVEIAALVAAAVEGAMGEVDLVIAVITLAPWVPLDGLAVVPALVTIFTLDLPAVVGASLFIVAVVPFGVFVMGMVVVAFRPIERVKKRPG